MKDQSWLNGLLILSLVLLAACGDDDSPQSLPQESEVTTEALNPFCTNFSGSEQCQAYQSQGLDFGWEEYYSSDQDSSDQAFDGGAGFCGCRKGTRPVLFRGLRMCEEDLNIKFLRTGIHLQYLSSEDSESEEESGRLAYGYFPKLKILQKNKTDLADGCYPEVALRCENNSDCEIKDVNGLEVSTHCEPLKGQKYGYCKESNPDS